MAVKNLEQIKDGTDTYNLVDSSAVHNVDYSGKDVNFDEMTTDGIYAIGKSNATYVNPPPCSSTSLWGFLEVIVKSNSIVQVYHSYNNRVSGVYERVRDGGSWSAWKTIAFTDSDITGNAATATRATNDGNGNNIADSIYNVRKASTWLGDTTYWGSWNSKPYNPIAYTDITYTGNGGLFDRFALCVGNSFVLEFRLGIWISSGSLTTTKVYMERKLGDISGEDVYVTIRSTGSNKWRVTIYWKNTGSRGWCKANLYRIMSNTGDAGYDAFRDWTKFSDRTCRTDVLVSGETAVELCYDRSAEVYATSQGSFCSRNKMPNGTAITDLDNVYSKGKTFFCEVDGSIGNVPDTTSWWLVETRCGNDSTNKYAVQIAARMTTGGVASRASDTYVRMCEGNSWKSWVKLAKQSAVDGKQDALPTTGTASDTYAINVSGNADNSSTADKLNLMSRASCTDANVVDSGKVKVLISSSSMTSNKPEGDGYILHCNWDTTNYAVQIYIPESGHKFQYRARYNGTWTSWGNLPANITGNAATATKATGDKNGDDITTTYAKLSGATFTGDIGVNKKSLAEGDDAVVRVKAESHAGNIRLMSEGTSAGYRGLYIDAHGTGSKKWALKVDTNNNVTLEGSADHSSTCDIAANSNLVNNYGVEVNGYANGTIVFG